MEKRENHHHTNGYQQCIHSNTHLKPFTLFDCNTLKKHTLQCSFTIEFAGIPAECVYIMWKFESQHCYYLTELFRRLEAPPVESPGYMYTDFSCLSDYNTIMTGWIC